MGQMPKVKICERLRFLPPKGTALRHAQKRQFRNFWRKRAKFQNLDLRIRAQKSCGTWEPSSQKGFWFGRKFLAHTFRCNSEVWYKGVPRLLRECFLQFQWCFICVSRVFQRHYKASLINFYPANIRNLAESFWPDTQVPRNTFDFFHLWLVDTQEQLRVCGQGTLSALEFSRVLMITHDCSQVLIVRGYHAH